MKGDFLKGKVMSVCINKSGVVWAGILICVCCARVVWAEEKAAPPPDPYANVRILVEAFVVEVSTAGLQDVGVNPIGAGTDGITVAKLAACLMNESANVISGAKVSAKQNEKGTSKENRTIIYKQINKSTAMVIDGKPVTGIGVRYSDYDFIKQLSVSPVIRPDRSIAVGYSYEEGGVTPDVEHYDPNDETPPSRYAYSWDGRLSLVSGHPVIAGAAQNKDRVVFLILTATVQNMPEVKQEQADIVPSPN
jgi:hypothetical protein